MKPQELPVPLNPTTAILIEFLKHMEIFIVSVKFSRRREKKFYKERSKMIVDYSEQLKKNEIGPYTFLKVMANIRNNVLYSDSSISVEDVEVELTSNIELESPPVDTVLEIPHENTEIGRNDDIDDIPLLVYLGDSWILKLTKVIYK